MKVLGFMWIFLNLLKYTNIYQFPKIPFTLIFMIFMSIKASSDMK